MSICRDILFILIENLSEQWKFFCKLGGNFCFFLGCQAKIRMGLDSQNESIEEIVNP